jgi:branched-chain amino acid transport system substrate-binding protein
MSALRLSLIALLATACTERNPTACVNSGVCPAGSFCSVARDERGRAVDRCVPFQDAATGADASSDTPHDATYVDAPPAGDVTGQQAVDVASADVAVDDSRSPADQAIDLSPGRPVDVMPEVATAPPDAAIPDYTLGAIFSTSGILASLGTVELKAVQLAIEEINAAGGIAGGRLRLEALDDGGRATMAESAAGSLLGENVPVIFGSTGSAATLAIARRTVPAKTFLLSPSATAVELALLPDQGFVACTCGSDADEGRLFARRAWDQGHTRAAILHAPGSYGTELATSFQNKFLSLGGFIAASAEIPSQQSSYSPLLSTTYAATPQVIFLVGGDPVDSAQLLRDYVSGFSNKNTAWKFSDSLYDPSIQMMVGAQSFTFDHEGAIISAAAPTTPRFTAFRVAYQNRYGGAPDGGFYAAAAYDSVFLVALAANAAGKVDGTAIRDKLTSVSSGGTKFGPAEYKAAAEAARRGDDIDFEGASGPTDLDANGNVITPYDIWRFLTNGTIATKESSVLP